MPEPNAGETQEQFIERCMSSEEANSDFPDQEQRLAFCYSQWRSTNDELPTTAGFVADQSVFDLSARQYTDEGYLEVPARVARTGIQYYLAKEITPDEGEEDPGGLRDRAPNSLVAVYRPPEEVFSDQSLATYNNADVTNNHPPRLVDAKTFKTYSVGNVMERATAEGEYVKTRISIKDAQAIRDVESGKKQLSAGYRARYEYAPGTAPDGSNYEFVQRDIKINHVALVDNGRAGPGASIFDRNNGGSTMPNVTIDGKSVPVQDESTAHLIQRALDEGNSKSEKLQEEIDNLKKQLEDKQDEYEKMEADRDSVKAEKDQLEKTASDEAIAERIKQVTDLKSEATKMVGDQFSCDSTNPLEIKRAALKQLQPNVNLDEKGEAYVDAAWDIEKGRSTADRASATHQQLAADMQRPTEDANKVSQDAREEYRKHLRGEGGSK